MTTPIPAVAEAAAAAAAVAQGHTIPSTAILATERLYLRPFVDSDAGPMAEACQDPDMSKYMRSHFPRPYTLADAEFWITYCHSSPGPGQSPPPLSFGIFTTAAGEYVGSVSLQPPKGDLIYAGTREIGYLSARKAWGRGFMTEAVRALTRWAFATLPDLLRIEAAVFEPNAASRRVLEKAGFVKEGTRRLAVVKDGKQMSEDVFGLIRTDIEA